MTPFLAACVREDWHRCYGVIWVRSDPPASEEMILQCADAFGPLRCWVTNAPWHWLREACSIQVDTRVRECLAGQAAGRTPQPATKGHLQGWSPDVPFVVLVQQLNVITIGHEVCHVFGVGHRNESGYLNSGKVKATDPPVYGGWKMHDHDAWYVRQAVWDYGSHWYASNANGGWGFAWKTPVGRFGWQVHTGPVDVPRPELAGLVSVPCECEKLDGRV